MQSSGMERQLEIEATLERARTQTDALLAPISDGELVARISPLVVPLVQDLARIAYFEDLWILRRAKGDQPIPELHDSVYRGLRHADTGTRSPSLEPGAVRAYAVDVRERVLDFLEHHVDFDTPNPLLKDGFVFGLVVQHELQRQEAMTETLQLRTEREYPLPAPDMPDRAPGGPSEIRVPGGVFVLGALAEPWAYDNELPAHEVELPPFRIDRTPVTNGLFAEFVQDRGYRTRRLWTDEGWEWREREGAVAPLYWERGADGWERIRLGHREPLPPWEPVQHISWHEASAFAAWSGRRLPTEAEWERAASWHRREGKQRYPWGQEWTGFEASLDRRRFSPAPAGSYAGGMSPVGCVQMVGDVWEWTSSMLEPYPDFLAFPYPEYSEAFFGDEYRVLRGGSWATAGLVARATFRHWQPPEARRAFTGFRCARDA
jgi:gamma-glutamyl hercynylcysteine S-oxide synthase